MLAIAEGAISGKNKNYDIATEFIQKAKDLNKKLAQIYLVTGDMYLYQSEYGKGANEYENAIYYDNKCTEAYFKLGRIYFTARNVEESEKALQSALRLDSTYIPALRKLSDLYFEKNNFSKSIEFFEKYLAFTEPNLSDHILYTKLLYVNKDYQKSLEEANKALMEDKENINMKRFQAYNLFEIKDYSNALKSINTFFMTTNPTKFIASDYEYYGKILSKNSQDSLAIENFNKAMQMDSLKTSLYQDIALSYDRQKKYEQSALNYEKLIMSKQNPASSDFFYYGRAAYIVANKYKNANDTLNENVFLIKADTAFGTVVTLSPQVFLGFLWKARVCVLKDPNMEFGLAKPWYDQVITILESNSR